MRKPLVKPISLLCTLLLLEGAVLRFCGLTRSYDYDEIFTAITADPTLSWGYILKHYLLTDVHPPLYNFIMWGWNHMVVYGPEWIGRLPSVAFGIGALWAGWKLFPIQEGKEKEEKTARWIFILLLAFNHPLIWQAQYMRAYSLLLFLSVPLTFLYLRMCRRIICSQAIPAQEWIYYAALSLLLCYSHYFGAFTFGIFSLILAGLAYAYKQPKRWFIWVPFIVGILFMPWLMPHILCNITQVRFKGNWWANMWFVNEYSNLLGMTRYKVIEFFGYFCTHSWGKITALIFVPLSVYFNRKHFQKFPYKKEIILSLLPFMLALGLTLLTFQKFYLLICRYFTPFMPGVFLATAMLLAPLFTRFRWFMLLIAANCAYSIFGFIYYLQTAPLDLGMSNGRIWASIILERPAHTVLTAAVEGYPAHTVEKLFSYYLNTYFKQPMVVKDLTYLPTSERNELLANPQTTVYMPLCDEWKIDKLFEQWGWIFLSSKTKEGFCILKPVRLQTWPEFEKSELSQIPTAARQTLTQTVNRTVPAE